MTSPHDPAAPDAPLAEPPSEPTGPSLSDRLAELEPDDDGPFFDVDPYDDEEDPYDEPVLPGYVPYAPPPYAESAPAVDLSRYAPVHDDPASAAAPHEIAYEALDAGAPYGGAPYDGAGAPAQPEPLSAPPYDESVQHVSAADDPYDEGALATPAHTPSDALVVAAAPALDAPVTPTDIPVPAEGTLTAAAGEPRRGRRRRARRRISIPVLALLLTSALMAAATTYLWLEVRERRQVEDARRSGLDAGRDAARLLFSYDYRTLQKDFSTGRSLTTGEFRKDYEKTTTKLVEDAAVRYKAVVKATVVQAGVVRATPSTVVTVVYVNQVTTSTRVTGQKVDLSRVRMALRLVDGRWLVERVDAL